MLCFVPRRTPKHRRPPWYHQSSQRNPKQNANQASSLHPWATAWFNQSWSAQQPLAIPLGVEKENDLQLLPPQMANHPTKHEQPHKDQTTRQHAAKDLESVAVEGCAEGFGGGDLKLR
jgi:hypothetical protein